MTDKGKKTVKFALTSVLAVILVYFAFRGVSWSAFWEGLMETRWIWIILAVAAAFAAVLLRTFRWRKMMLPLDEGIGVADTFHAENVGNLANLALPGIGEFIRCGMVRTGKASYEKVFGTMVMERIWDFIAIGIMFVLALASGWKRFGTFFVDNIVNPVSGRFSGILLLIFGLIVLAGSAFIFLTFKLRGRFKPLDSIASAIEGLLAGLSSFSRMKGKPVFALYTVGIWSMYTLMAYFGLKALPDLSDLGIMDALFISAVGNIASVVPVPGGIGAYHYLTALTLSMLFSSSWETGILFATLSHESHGILLILLGVYSYARGSLRQKNNKTI